MSRIGRAPIAIPSGVTAEINGQTITVKGPLATLTENIAKEISVAIEDNHVVCSRHSEDKAVRALHGLSRALINNMIVGVTKGFERTLVVHGVGYKTAVNGKKLVLNIGYSHPCEIEAPEGITFVQAAPLEIVVKGSDKQQVGQIAATIKDFKRVEPYHGYGIHYKDEEVVRKEGKKAGK